MNAKRIIVKAGRNQEAVLNGQCEVIEEFETLKDARKHAQYYTSEAFRVVCEASDRLGYSAVFVNDECVNDYFTF